MDDVLAEFKEDVPEANEEAVEALKEREREELRKQEEAAKAAAAKASASKDDKKGGNKKKKGHFADMA